jgi:hypothetical protein
MLPTPDGAADDHVRRKAMMEFDDPRWEEMEGGYRNLYDPRPVLNRMKAGDQACWDELWEELHHQGDVGEASYATVPHLVAICGRWPARDWNLYAIVGTIEIERHRQDNPLLPDWLLDDYRQAWTRLAELGQHDLMTTEDGLTIRSILGVLALARGKIKLGMSLCYGDEDEIDQLAEERYAWSELYREQIDG